MTTATLENHVAVRQLREAQEQVERIKNDAPQNFPAAASIGDAVRQGDIYIQLIEDIKDAPLLYKRANPTFPMQLAPGNTKGSRHCLEHGRGATVYEPVDMDKIEFFESLGTQYNLDAASAHGRQRQLQEAEWEVRRNAKPGIRPQAVSSQEAMALLEFAGPIFCLTETNTVTHPEHGDWILPPGTYRVTYQRTVTKENTVTRVLD